MKAHRTALIVITAALALDALLGLAYSAAQHIPVWHGLYCALANAVTLGGDVSPTTPAGYWVNAAECVLVVPLFAATFSLFTSGLTATHIGDSEARIKRHLLDLETRLARHRQGPSS
jgi:NhaP-type Na+/H+ or K+/H+ antiporter